MQMKVKRRPMPEKDVKVNEEARLLAPHGEKEAVKPRQGMNP